MDVMDKIHSDIVKTYEYKVGKKEGMDGTKKVISMAVNRIVNDGYDRERLLRFIANIKTVD